MSSKRIKLSFEADDDDEEEREGVAAEEKNSNRSSKKVTAKTKRPIMQAPVIIELDSSLQSQSAPQTSAYSQENLDALRKIQNFSTSTIEDSYASASLVQKNGKGKRESETSMMVELSGDQAEALDLAMDPEESGIESSIECSRALLKHKRDAGRVFTSSLHAKQTSVRDFDLAPNDNQWEDEIIQRGSIHLKPSASATAKNNTNINNSISSSKGSSGGGILKQNSGYYEESLPDLQDLTQITQTAVTQTQVAIDEHERRLQLLEQEMIVARDRAAGFDRQLDEALRRLKTTELARRFWPDLVGLLREKDPYLTEIMQALDEHWCQYGKYLVRMRVAAMEGELLAAKRAGQLIGIGSYSPSSVLSNDIPVAVNLRSDFVSATESIRAACVALMEDAAPELLDATQVFSQIRLLRSHLGDGFYKAHMPVSIAGLLWPLLQLELMQSMSGVLIHQDNDNNGNGGDGAYCPFSSSRWISAVRDFLSPSSNAEREREEESDDILLRHMWQRAAKGFLLPVLEHGLDLTVARNAKTAAGLVEDLMALIKLDGLSNQAWMKEVFQAEEKKVRLEVGSSILSTLRRQSLHETCYALCKTTEPLGLICMTRLLSSITTILSNLQLFASYVPLDEAVHWLQTGLIPRLLPVLNKLSTTPLEEYDCRPTLQLLIQAVVALLGVLKEQNEGEFDYEIGQAGLGDWSKLLNHHTQQGNQELNVKQMITDLAKVFRN